MKHLLLLAVVVLGINFAQAQELANLGTISGRSNQITNSGFSFDSKDEGWVTYKKHVQYSGWDSTYTIFNRKGTDKVWLTTSAVEPNYISKMNSNWAKATFNNFVKSLDKQYKKQLRKNRIIKYSDNAITDKGDDYVLAKTSYKISNAFRITILLTRSKKKNKITTRNGEVHYKYDFKITQYEEIRNLDGTFALDNVIASDNEKNENPF